MTSLQLTRIVHHDAPGEFRAVALDPAGKACRLFIERWNGVGSRARLGSVHRARIRRFADEIGGAFLELESGQEAIIRLRDRGGFTEGAALRVEIVSEARSGKLARVQRTEKTNETQSGLALWQSQLPGDAALDEGQDRETVEAAFDEALAPSVTLQGGGQLHIDRTRALTAFDVDTSGRLSKGSAGARALAVNRDAASELARQVALRGLGGNLVLDCVGPLNTSAGDQIQARLRSALEQAGVEGAKVLRPSAIGLLEASVPWRSCPIEDVVEETPGETDLLGLFRDVQREAAANPTKRYRVALSKSTWRAYVHRRSDADEALRRHLSGRVEVIESDTNEDRVQSR